MTTYVLKRLVSMVPVLLLLVIPAAIQLLSSF